MKAILLSNNNFIKYKNISIKPLPAQWARVKVNAVGLCGTDVAKIVGKNIHKDHTQILGHEFIGQIASIHGNSDRLSVGNWVTGMPMLPCRKCDLCIQKKENLCIKGEAIGRTTQGAFADFVNVPLRNLISIPGPNDVYTLTDPLAVCLHALQHTKNLKTNSKSLIIGDGPIGCLLTWLLLKRGSRVSIKGIHPDNLHFAKEMGADIIKNDVKTLYYDSVYETVGRAQPQTLTSSLRAIKAGGYVVVLGVYAPNYMYSLLARDLFIKECALIGSNAYTWRDFKEATELIHLHQEELSKFLSHTFQLNAFNIALSTAKDKKGFTMKIVLKPENKL